MINLGNYKTKIVTDRLEGKLRIAFHDGTERTGWYELGGIKLLRVTIPKQHGHGDDSLSPKVAKDVINRLRLTRDEFEDLYKCPMSGADYKQKVVEMQKQGLI